MSTVKASILPRNDNDEQSGDIADWLDGISSRNMGRNTAFRRTIDSLMGG